LATQSRSALGGWVAGAVYLTWRELRAHPRQLAAALASGIAVLVLAATAAPSVAARVGHVSTDLVVDRVQIWRIAVGIVASHPLLGTGPGTFQTMFNQRKPAGFERKWSAHNLWLHYAVETGLVGLLSILWIVYVAGREWARSGRLPLAGQDPFRPTITAASIGLLVDSCGDNTLLSVSTVSGAWLLLALLVVAPAWPVRPDHPVLLAPRDEAVLVTGTRSREGSP
jgi:putative inorganic carbon (hco3(-)) transporter